MISEFVREQKRYTKKELSRILHCMEDRAIPLIRKLKEFGVLKAVRASQIQRDLSVLLEEDIEVADIETGEDAYLYVFTFVGVIVIAGCVLKCYPKYLMHTEAPRKELQQVLKVLQKYHAKEQRIRMFHDSSDSHSFHLLSVLLFLMQDYYENGVYSNTETVMERNGSGEILWEKTINETFTMISDNRPYYVELQTKKRVTDDHNYLKRLHACMLTRASKELQDADRLELFDLTAIDLTDEELDEFGEEDEILYRIEKELSVQFNTRKQMVLKAMYAYLAHRGHLCDAESFSLFGTNSFHLVWENVCADIMDNQLDVPLGSIALPVPLKPQYDRKQKLVDLIEKPLWTASGKTAKDTLIPDLITIAKAGHEYQFIIFDAKYYNARLECGVSPKGQPGIESVTKQYLYQLAYQKFIEEHEFASVKNCFLMPTENPAVEVRGEVSMRMFHELGLQNIQVRFLPADMAYEYYLSGRKMEIGILEL